MAVFDNIYTRTWEKFNDYVERNGSEVEQEEYDRLSDSVDEAAEHVPWWQRI